LENASTSIEAAMRGGTSPVQPRTARLPSTT